MLEDFTFIETPPSAEDFCRLRTLAGLSPRNLDAAKKGLPASCYAVHILHKGIPVGMAELIDIADNWLDLKRLELTVYVDNAPAIRLYEKFGFQYVSPACEGMAISWNKTSVNDPPQSGNK